MKKELKKIMTDLAAGRISQKEVEDLTKDEKVAQNKPDKEFEGSESKDKPKKRKRKQVLKNKEDLN